MSLFYKQGILKDDPRISNIRKKVEQLGENILSKDKFFELIHQDASEIEQLLYNQKTIPDFESFKQSIKAIF